MHIVDGRRKFKSDEMKNSLYGRHRRLLDETRCDGRGKRVIWNVGPL